MPQCRLCLEDIPKLCHSHIIPELLYKPLYSKENHRIEVLSYHPDAKPHIKKGVREYMLCIECEGKLNQWETYFASLQNAHIQFQVDSGRNLGFAYDIDYKKFKLFQMSILWRCGISKHYDFSKVSIGPHAEKLRRMIYEENPGEPWDYGCMFLVIPDHASLMSQMMMLGMDTRFDGHKCINFMLGGLSWTYIVSSHSKTLFGKERMFLSKEGRLPLVVDNGAAKKSFEYTIREMRKTGRFDWKKISWKHHIRIPFPGPVFTRAHGARLGLQQGAQMPHHRANLTHNTL